MSNTGEYFDIDKVLENENTKIAEKIRDLRDADCFSVVIKGSVFWVECRPSWSDIPKYAMKWLKSKMKRQGYDYLYDKKIQRQ